MTNKQNIYLKPVETNLPFQKNIVQFREETLKGTSLQFTTCDATNPDSPFSNLFSSFRLPITAAEKKAFMGQYGNTALRAFADVRKFVVAAIPKENYGEMVDGKSIELVFPMEGGSYGVYSTFFGFNSDLNGQFSDSNAFSGVFGTTPTPENDFNSNVAYLFSNEIAKPKEKVVKTKLINTQVTFQNSLAFSTVKVDLAAGENYEMLINGSKDVEISVALENNVMMPIKFAMEQTGENTYRPLYKITMLTLVNKEGTNPLDLTISQISVGGNGSWSKWRSDFKFPNEQGGFGKSVASFSDEKHNLLIDEPVGIAFLDKGLIVITHPEMVAALIAETKGYPRSLVAPEKAWVKYKSIVTEFAQNITCVALPNEFNESQNPTFSEAYPDGLGNNDSLFVTEIGLYNKFGDLIAIAKTSEPVKKNKLNVAVFDIKLKL